MQEHVLRLATPSIQTSMLFITLGPDSKQNLKAEDVLVLLNEDCFKTGSWKRSEITSLQHGLQEQDELVLCFEKSVSKKRKFKVSEIPERYSARLSNGPFVVESSTIEHQGGGLPSRIRKIPLPQLVLQNSSFVSRLAGRPQIGIRAGEDLSKNQRVTEYTGVILQSKEEAGALLNALNVSYLLFLFSAVNEAIQYSCTGSICQIVRDGHRELLIRDGHRELF